MALVAPSLLAADFAYLEGALEMIRAAGVSMIHADVMDGHFAPDIAMGQPVIASLRKATPLLIEAHLLIERPERYIAGFIEAGADRVSVHEEATPDLRRALEMIRRCGAKAGVALNPGTPVGTLTEVLDELDFLTILTQEPPLPERSAGLGALSKVRAAARAREESGDNFELEVEGRLGLEHLEELARAGADILVVSSGIFDNEDPKGCLSEMVRQAASTVAT